MRILRKLSLGALALSAALPLAACNQASTSVSSSSNPFAGQKLYVSTGSPALKQANAWRSSRPADAAQLDKIANRPTALWLNGSTSDVQGTVSRWIGNAANQGGAMQTLVLYNIPHRDCGMYSAGGVADEAAYTSWVKQVAAGIGSSKAAVILEPDGLWLLSCLKDPGEQASRLKMMSEAVSILKSNPRTAVYIDAGRSGESAVSMVDMASRLRAAGVAQANGFSLNIAHFESTSTSVAYGTQLSALLGGKHFVVDTGRNGQGPAAGNPWCNPSGRGLGQAPTANTGSPLVDAFLWIKYPGNSDGTCNGGPSAGTFWPTYAVGLAQRAA